MNKSQAKGFSELLLSWKVNVFKWALLIIGFILLPVAPVGTIVGICLVGAAVSLAIFRIMARSARNKSKK